MPKWLTAIFALFLSVQVFGSRGKAVDKFLGSCFSFDIPDTVCRVQNDFSRTASRNFWKMPACYSEQATMSLVWIPYFQFLSVAETAAARPDRPVSPKKEIPVAIFPLLK